MEDRSDANVQIVRYTRVYGRNTNRTPHRHSHQPKNHADWRLEVVSFMTPSAPYEKCFFVSGRSMVARVKLEGIDGAAPPGVEPAAQFDSTRENSLGPDIVRIDSLVALS